MCLVTQLCPTLSNPMDCHPPGSSVHRDSPGKNTEWLAMPSSLSSQPRDQTQVSCVAGGFFTDWVTKEAYYLLYKGKNRGSNRNVSHIAIVFML